MSIFIILIFLLTGCDAHSPKEAINQVVNFRQLYNENKFSTIYLSSTDDLKNSISEKDFSGFLTKESLDVGKYKGAKLLNSMVKNNSEISLTYNTEYEKDQYFELFVYRKEKGIYRLYYYTIDTQKKLALDPVTHALKLPN